MGSSTQNNATTKEHAENNVTNNQEWNYFGKDTQNENTHDYSEVKGMDIGGKVTMMDNGYNAGVQVFSATLPKLQELVIMTGKLTNDERFQVPSTSFAIPMTSFAHLPLQELVSCPAGQQYDNEAGQCAVIITNTGTMNISLL